jgi:hypothetical protein
LILNKTKVRENVEVEKQLGLKKLFLSFQDLDVFEELLNVLRIGAIIKAPDAFFCIY